MICERDFLDFTERVLGVEKGSLSLESACGSIPEWDSTSHIRLMLEIESTYGVKFKFDEVVRINTVGKFLACINGEV
jgi:acyl carrier protein